MLGVGVTLAVSVEQADSQVSESARSFSRGSEGF